MKDLDKNALFDFFLKKQKNYERILDIPIINHFEGLQIIPYSIPIQNYLSVLNSILQNRVLCLPEPLKQDYTIILDWMALQSVIPQRYQKNPVINLLICATFFIQFRDSESVFIQGIISQIMDMTTNFYMQKQSQQIRNTIDIRYQIFNIFSIITVEILINRFLRFIDSNATIDMILTDFTAFFIACTQNTTIKSNEIKKILQFSNFCSTHFLPMLDLDAISQAIQIPRKEKNIQDFMFLLQKYYFFWTFRYHKPYLNLDTYYLYIFLVDPISQSASRSIFSYFECLHNISFSFFLTMIQNRIRIGLSIPAGMEHSIQDTLKQLQNTEFIQNYALLKLNELSCQITIEPNLDTFDSLFLNKRTEKNSFSFTQSYAQGEMLPHLSTTDLLLILPMIMINKNVDFLEPRNNLNLITGRILDKIKDWKADSGKISLSNSIKELIPKINLIKHNFFPNYFYEAWKLKKIVIFPCQFIQTFLSNSSHTNNFHLFTNCQIDLPLSFYEKISMNGIFGINGDIIQYLVFLDINSYNMIIQQWSNNHPNIFGIHNVATNFLEMNDMIHLWDCDKEQWILQSFEQEFKEKILSNKSCPNPNKARELKNLPIVHANRCSSPLKITYNKPIMEELGKNAVLLSANINIKKSLFQMLFSVNFNIETCMEKYCSQDLLKNLSVFHRFNTISFQNELISIFISIRIFSEFPITPQVLWESPDLNPIFSLGLQEIYFWPGFCDSQFLLEYRLPKSALEPKGQFTRLIKYLKQFHWDINIYEIEQIQHIFHERAIFSEDWHFTEFLNLTGYRSQSDHPLQIYSLRQEKSPLIGRITYPWQYWQTLQYVYEFCFRIPFYTPQIENELQILFNELEIAIGYYLIDTNHKKEIIILCRYNRNVQKLIEAIKQKLLSWDIIFYYTSFVNFIEFYPNHPLSDFMQRSRDYINSPRLVSIQLPIFSTIRNILYSPQDQLAIFETVEAYTSKITPIIIVKINQIATQLKKLNKLTHANLIEAFNCTNNEC